MTGSVNDPGNDPGKLRATDAANGTTDNTANNRTNSPANGRAAGTAKGRLSGTAAGRTSGLCRTGNPRIFQVKVPVPYPLRWINAYLIQGDNGFTVIDPGLRTDDALAEWDGVWKELGAGYRNVERIVLTHHHPDHYGLAGLFQEKSGAPVHMSEKGFRLADRLWGEDRKLTEDIWRLFIRNGMDRQTAGEMIPHMEGFVPLVFPQPEVTFRKAGEALRMGDHFYEVIESEGHATGHLSFYRAETAEIICGDHVLPQISPNVSYLPGVDENPLASYMQSLEAIAAYRVNMAYPGHREPFAGFEARCRELLVHHERRLDLMHSHLAEGPLTAYELCLRLFGTRLTLHQMRFALSETIAHLIYLDEDGRAAKADCSGVDVYHSVHR